MSGADLEGHVAVVTGATRGGGRGIALELGARGATVYVTGRSTRAEPRRTGPGTIEDTAEEVTRAGGTGIPVRCDHTREEDVSNLFARVFREQPKLDLLVNNAWGGNETFDGVFDAPFWKHSLAHWESMFDHGVRNHIVASRFAAPKMVEQGHGLIVTTSYWDRDRYMKGIFFYDLAKATMNRLAFAMAEELRPHGVASVAVAPGWMRTEHILEQFQTDEAHWKDVPPLARTESPHYLGRGVAALAGDGNVLAKSGKVLLVADLAREYGFTDIDGRLVAAFEM